jgi:MFS family permease
LLHDGKRRRPAIAPAVSVCGRDATRATRISDPLRERRLVWWAQFCCAMGQGMGAILLTWLVLDASHGAASIGLCIAAGLLPLSVGAATATRRAERHDRRLLLVGAQGLLALVAAGLVLMDQPPLWVIAGAALLSGLARVAFDATAMSVLHHLVDAARLPSAARDLTTRFHVGHLCGAALVAALVPAVPPHEMFAVCALVFVAGAVISSRHHPDIDLRPGSRAALDRALPGGRAALHGEAGLRPLWIATVAAGISAGGGAALVVPYLRDDLRLGTHVGVVFLCGVVALAAAMLVVPRLVHAMPWHVLAACALAAQPAALAVLALAGSAGTAAAAYGALLAAGGALGIVINHRRTSVVADGLRVPVGLAGGVLSARAVALGAVVVGAASIPLGEQRAYLALALLGAVTGAAAYLSARPPVARRPA